MTARSLAVDTSTPPPESPVIRLDHVTKTYKSGGGVSNVSLNIAKGEVFGFLGPNGAGKTTVIRLLLDLIRPNAGSIQLFGLDSRRDSVTIHQRIGYIPGELGLYERFTPREILAHFAYLRGDIPWTEVAPLIDAMDLEIDKPVRTLSKGNRQKVGLIAAFMGEPALLILDEPTSGLDPLVQQQVHEQVRRAALNGRTVFLSSHDLSEVAVMAGRVGLIRKGQLIAVERVTDLAQRSVHVIDVTFASAPDATFLASLNNVHNYEINDVRLHAEVTGDLNPLIALLSTVAIADLSIREPGLEEMFLSFYEGSHD